MCTTLLVISTLAILLRRHFFNRVEPYVLPHLFALWRGGEGAWELDLSKKPSCTSTIKYA
uniref:Uncharacterized protein n=1 Tax=Chelonoidis abingdonii TaxID=106734 RepID=A0A8C0IPM7_CHEAB